MDIFFKNNVSSLVYMRDISNLVEQSCEMRKEYSRENKVFDIVLEEPDNFLDGLNSLLEQKANGEVSAITKK